MIWRFLADLVLVLHLVFILVVVLGGLVVLRWPRFVWVHLPCAVWGLLVELAGWYCPLTPLENGLRRHGGEAGIGESFVAHYLLPVIYPRGLTREVQFVLAAAVVVVNVAVYAVVMARRRRRSSDDRSAPGRPR
jgi:hypothetical protein